MIQFDFIFRINGSSPLSVRRFFRCGRSAERNSLRWWIGCKRNSFLNSWRQDQLHENGAFTESRALQAAANIVHSHFATFQRVVGSLQNSGLIRNSLIQKEIINLRGILVSIIATIFKPNAASQRQLAHFGNFESREIFDEVGAHLRCRWRQHFITAGYSVDRGKLASLIR